MKKRYISFLMLVIVFVFSNTVVADKQSELKKQQSQTQSEMNEIKQKINKAEQSKTPYLEN